MSPLSLVVETEMTKGGVRRDREEAKAILACHRIVVAGNVKTLPLERATLDAETEHMRAEAVNRTVNSVKNDGEACIEPIGEPPLTVP